MDAIVLLAHGSPDPNWRVPVEAVRDRLRALAPQTPCCCAYLSSCPPTLVDAVSELLGHADASRARITRIRIVPLFLGIGRHVREDLPVLVRQLQASHLDVPISLDRPISENPRLIDMLAQIAADAGR